MDVHWFLSQYAYHNSYKINRDLLKIVFEQTEKRLMETIALNRELLSRGYRLLMWSLLLFTLTLGYFITHSLYGSQKDFFALVSLLGSVIFLFTSGLSLAAILPYPFYGLGSEPRWTLNRSIVESENQTAAFLLNECNEYQLRIVHNMRINARRKLLVHTALYILILVPFSLVIAAALE